jgi:hypothetical protein
MENSYVNEYLNNLEAEYNKSKDENKPMIENKPIEEKNNYDNPINRIPKEELNKQNNVLYREMSLWDNKQETSLPDVERQSFYVPSQKNNVINDRLNSRVDCPRILPFSREIRIMEMRPQFSRDIDTKPSETL